jgi:hypothetical protein
METIETQALSLPAFERIAAQIATSKKVEREFAFGAGLTASCAEVWRMRLAHGSLLLIPARTNEALNHRLPPTKRVKGLRVNITLRRFLR